MKRLAACIVIVVGTIGSGGQAFAHAGGHHGGCEDFGHVNLAVGQDPAAFGFPAARNLGDIVSSFTSADDGQPGVGDVVETIDHLACGDQ